MNCEVCLLDSSADPLMWACVGCHRKFHAACIGVVAQRSSLRSSKTSKKIIDPLSYVMPCCGTCQNLVTANFEFNGLVEQQVQLADQIHKNTEVVHRSARQNNISLIHDTIDRLDTSLHDIKKQLTENKSNISNENISALKNHLTTLCDIAIQSSKDNTSKSIELMTVGIADELKCLKNEMKHFNTLSLNLASGPSTNTSVMFGIEILDELRSLSTSVNTLESKITASSSLNSVDSTDSLQYELNGINNTQTIDRSGWRFLGTKKVWKADWTDYDRRRLHRLRQQKQAEKARKRQTQARRNHNNNRSNNNYYNNNNFNTRNYGNNNNINRYYRNSGNGTNNHNNNNNRDYNYNFHNNNNSLNCNTNANVSNSNFLLPPDRVLLAAAKHQFSRPPSDYRPNIQFERGETLIPYSVYNEPSRSIAPGLPPASGMSCSSQHPCFQRN